MEEIMIETKQQLMDTIKQDCLQRYGKESIHPKPFTNLTWKYMVTLRKLEYYSARKNRGGLIDFSINTIS